MGLLQKLRQGLAKTRHGLVEKVDRMLSGRSRIDEELYEELEEILLGADIGVPMTMDLLENLRQSVKDNKVENPAELTTLLKESMLSILGQDRAALNIDSHRPAVIMVVGVNGVGKTTTIGKLAHRFRSEGRKVLLAAADTFRAAAIEQLEIWGRREGVDVIRHTEGSDPAAVVYDAIQAARSRRVDILIIDTAGRLHTKTNLMEELKKVRRVIERELPGAPHEVLLVLDATTGQNAVNQAQQFGEAVGVTGIALTKLDGTAKGGIVLAIKGKLNIPVKLIGIGEQDEDLQDFSPKEYVEALFTRS